MFVMENVGLLKNKYVDNFFDNEDVKFNDCTDEEER